MRKPRLRFLPAPKNRDVPKNSPSPAAGARPGADPGGLPVSDILFRMGRDESLHEDASSAHLTGEKKLAAVLNSVWESVITVERDPRISTFNRAAERLVGIPAAEATGKDCRDVLKASFGPAQHDCPMGDLTEGGKPRSDVDGTLVRADGRIVPISASWAFLEDPAGERLGFVLSFRSFEEIERIAEERRARFPYGAIVGKTPRIRHLFQLIDTIKDTDSTVLITGESGTGKGLFARAIHDLSPRRDKPFVKVTCAALSETLLESELFGHVKGAFTGAIADKMGRFEAADGGTIFLDEIGDISLPLQVKLLRVIQEREFERVGSSRTQTVEVRVIAATNRDLKAAMKAGQFREDLFYRLHVIPIVVPSLRERRDDIPLLVDHILKRLKRPGNVRELENVLERGAVCSRGAVLSAADLSEEVREHSRPRKEEPAGAPPDSAESDAPGEEGEKERILRT